MAGLNNRVKITNDIELKDRLVAINRVTKVTKGGRTFSFSAIVVVGNEEGIIGWGLGKAGEVTAAIAKGVESAKKNLTKVPVLKGTVPHEQSAKFGGAEVFIKPASHGTGVVAGGAMRAVLESVGVTDVLAKSKGSSNPHNLVKATILALSEMRDARMVAQNRGVRMKVFLLLAVMIGFSSCQSRSKQNIEQEVEVDSLSTNPTEEIKIITGVVKDASMNNFMLITLQGDTLFISTMDQEPNDVAGFELGDTVRVNYIEEEEEPGLNTIPTAQKVIVIGKKNRNQ